MWKIAEFAKIPRARFSYKFHWITSTHKPHGRKKNFDVISHKKKVSVTISGTWRPSWIFKKWRIQRVCHIRFFHSNLIFRPKGSFWNTELFKKPKIVHNDTICVWLKSKKCARGLTRDFGSWNLTEAPHNIHFGRYIPKSQMYHWYTVRNHSSYVKWKFQNARNIVDLPLKMTVSMRNEKLD